MDGALRYAGALGFAGDVMAVIRKVVQPLFLLIVRLWLARIFFTHAMGSTMAAGGPFLGMTPQAALEMLCAALLALGLMTRVAAIPIAYLAFAVYFVDVGITGHVLCTLLALTLLVYGPGALSLDGLVGEGTGYSALPLSRFPKRVIDVLERFGAPILQLAIRVWLGIVFLSAAEPLINSGPPLFDLGANIDRAAVSALAPSPFMQGLLLVASILLISGFLARFASGILVLAALAAAFGPQNDIQHMLWALVLAQVAVVGAGGISVDAIIDRWLVVHVPRYTGKPDYDVENAPSVVIVGAGFGGLAAAKALENTPARVTVIDRHNYHLFQPLLYQVATAGLSPADIASPIRGALREQHNARVVLGAVQDVDTDAREVVLSEGRIKYDQLIIATGARHDYFGKDTWEQYAPGLKQIDDATMVRRRILLSFERAETADSEAERERLLTFVVVGGGPTGVELAGSIVELARQGMHDDFTRIDPAKARVILVQAGDRVLPTFTSDMSAEALKALQNMGVEVRLDSLVSDIDARGCVIAGEYLPAGVILWAAGVRASRAAKWLGAEADRAGRVIVNATLNPPGHPEIFVVGDTASMKTVEGGPVPGLAPAAKQAGTYAAQVITARLRGEEEPGPFRYRHLGSLATIGRDSAVADFGWFRIHGWPAWWLWGFVHIFFLLGTRNRFSVMLSWIYAYLSYRRSSRLITGPVGHGDDESEEDTRTVAATAA